MIWQYTVLSIHATRLDELASSLEKLGSVGWEAVGLSWAEMPLAGNPYTVVLKRQTPGLAAPVDTAPAWLQDPVNPRRLRHWDGLRWTEHVSVHGDVSVDFPVMT